MKLFWPNILHSRSQRLKLFRLENNNHDSINANDYDSINDNDNDSINENDNNSINDNDHDSINDHTLRHPRKCLILAVTKILKKVE